jgi:hypothetical protein
MIEYLAKYTGKYFLTVQCDVCNAVSFGAVHSHMQLFNIRDTDICEVAEKAFAKLTYSAGVSFYALVTCKSF